MPSMEQVTNRDFTGQLSIWLVSLGSLWVSWWIWRFIISPTLNPSRPKILPYNTPWLGHIAQFVSDGNGLITRARLYFQNKRDPFALVLGGQYVYIITSAKDVTSCFKNVKDLTFDAYIEDMQLRFGASPAAVKAMWQKPGLDFLQERKDNHGFPNPHGKALAHISEAIFKAQLPPGTEMHKLSYSFLRIIHDRLQWHATPDCMINKRSSKDDERVVSLQKWVRYTLLYAATKSFFGEAIFRVDPKILEYFAAFDEDSWQFTYQVPELFAREMFKAKTRAQNVFDRYFELPQNERSDANWMVQTLESEMRAVGTESKDVSAYLMMLYWVINGNAWKAAFWLTSHILFDPILKSAIEESVKPLFSNTSKSTPEDIIKHLGSLPILVAAYNEALRICTSSITVRNVLEDCIVGNTRLQKGSRVIIPYRQLMMDETVFGPNPENFNVNRFLERPSLAKDPSFRPFGGGLTYCPGRFMAQKEILTLVGILFGKYDIGLPESREVFPKMETKKPCLGMMGPVAGQDILVNVRRPQAS